MEPEVFAKTFLVCRKINPIHSFGVFYGHDPLDFTFSLLLFDIIIVLFITKLVCIILKPIGQPRIVSDIIGGIIIGPSVFGRNKRYHEYMFHENSKFMIRNLAILGFMYFVFITGVKMDVTVIFKAKKKHWYISTIGAVVPLLTSITVALCMRKNVSVEELRTFASIYGMSTTIAITAFPVLYPVVRELNLLSSDIGRLALSLTLISDVIGMHGIVIFEAAKQGEGKSIAALWYTISFILVMGILVVGVRLAMDWIVKSTPEGEPVEEIYVVFILLGVCVAGFVTDMCGLAICNGPLWLGLAVPDGPPLGATIVEKCETFLMEFFMPFSFAYVGLVTDVSSMSGNWSILRPLYYMAFLGCITKVLAVLVAGHFTSMTFRDSLTLALIMSIRGQVELIMFVHWMDLKMIKQPQFTMLELVTVAVTAVATPMISIVYDPTKPYMVDKRRNIQHTAPNAELEIVACFYDEKNVGGISKLLEISNPTVMSPFSVHALHLTQLVGRAAALFMDHNTEEDGLTNISQSKIHNALKHMHKGTEGVIKMHYYTSESPKKTMYQDICEVALTKRASLIILPYHKDQTDSSTRTDVVKERVESINSNVLKHAPCSVAILVQKSSFLDIFQGRQNYSLYKFVVLFLGGPDSREALTYASRMADNPDVSLTLVRFLANDNQGDNMIEKKLDDGIVTRFWVKNEGNTRFTYREVVVCNGEETVEAIQAMNKSHYDLWIVGRKQGINPVLLHGLTSWYHNYELGAVGDFVASSDLDTAGSVLVIQQQILRGQDLASRNFLHRYTFSKRSSSVVSHYE